MNNFVIEHSGSSVNSPLYWCGMLGWTKDEKKAIRFGRQTDAQSVADYLERQPNSHRITQKD